MAVQGLTTDSRELAGQVALVTGGAKNIGRAISLALAAAGAKRTALMPEVPTLKEAGINGVEVVVWYGVLAPAGTPKEVVATLAAAIGRAARSPDIRQKLLDQGAEPVGNTPEEFGALLREEVTKWREVVRASGLKAE